LFCALPALALTILLALPDVSFAQRRGGGNFSSGIVQGAMGYPGYGGMGYGYGTPSSGYMLGYGLGSNLSGGGLGYGNYGYGGYGYGSGYGWNSPGYYGGSGWNSPGYYGGTTYPSNSYAWSGQTDGGWTGSGYQSFYPPTYGTQGYGTQGYGTQGYGTQGYGVQQASGFGQQQFNDGTRAVIRVHVRPDAQVMFEDSPTQQMGPERVFITPALEGKGNYSYKITARWRDQNGKEVSRVQTARFSAGKTVDVDFMNGQNQNQQNVRPGTSGTEESEPAQPNSNNPNRRGQELTPTPAPPPNPGNATNPGTTRPPQPRQPNP